MRKLPLIYHYAKEYSKLNQALQNTDRIPIQEEATLYVHWPYCEKRCTYCNFNKYISKNIDTDRMQNCLVTEIKTKLKFSQAKVIKSIFFGGGTPSLAHPKIIESVLNTISNYSKLNSKAEITIECNPNDLNKEKLKLYKKFGINRISIGVQSLNDFDLKVLGRVHSVADSIKSLEYAKLMFPGKTSVDIIYGRPGQTLNTWKEELHQVLKICDDHVSLYQLTLERGTSLFKRFLNNELKMPDNEEMADMYELAEEIMEQYGFHHYEVSNYSKKGAESVHNQSYWNGSQYIGIGPGAHGRIYNENQRYATIQTLEPNIWMSEVDRTGDGTRKTVLQSPQDILSEVLMTSLRTTHGLTKERWLQLFENGLSLSDVFKPNSSLQKLIARGLLQPIEGGNLIPTKKGMAVADTLVTELLPSVLKLSKEQT